MLISLIRRPQCWQHSVLSVCHGCRVLRTLGCTPAAAGAAAAAGCCHCNPTASESGLATCVWHSIICLTMSTARCCMLAACQVLAACVAGLMPELIPCVGCCWFFQSYASLSVLPATCNLYLNNRSSYGVFGLARRRPHPVIDRFQSCHSGCVICTPCMRFMFAAAGMAAPSLCCSA
jgi:hypothetical protein